MATADDAATLRARQQKRANLWNLLAGSLFVIGLLPPFVLMIAWFDWTQILKVLYPILSLFAAAFFFTQYDSEISAVIACCFGVACMIPILMIQRLSPNPSWYLTIVPLTLFVWQRIYKHIPALERQEWQAFKFQTGVTDSDILSFQKGQIQTAKMINAGGKSVQDRKMRKKPAAITRSQAADLTPRMADQLQSEDHGRRSRSLDEIERLRAEANDALRRLDD